MTLHELLHQVSFDEIIPFVKWYHGWNALALYKIHYDYLCHLKPVPGEETEATVRNGELDERADRKVRSLQYVSTQELCGLYRHIICLSIQS